MNERHRLYLVALLCLSIGAAVTIIASRWGGPRTSSANPAEPPVMERLAVSDVSQSVMGVGPGGVSPSGVAPKTNSPVPAALGLKLPDVSVPLALQLDTLVEQAKAGNPTAACRLVASINRCVTAAQRRAFSERVLNSLEKGKTNNPDMMIDLVARSEEQSASTADYCSGVEPQRLPSLEDALRNALPSLDPHQKTVVAMLRADGDLRRLVRTQPSSEPSTYVRPDAISSNQHSFLLAGFEAMDPLALEGLVMMHSPTSAIMSQGVWGFQPNVRSFLQYALLMARLYGPASLGEQGNRAVIAASSQLSVEELQGLGQEVELVAQRWARSRGGSFLGKGDVLQPEPPSLDPLERCGR